MENHTKREVRRAKEARRLQEVMGNISDTQFKYIIKKTYYSTIRPLSKMWIMQTTSLGEM